MLRSETINQIPVDNPAVYAFRIRGEIRANDLEAMAVTMNEAFDTQQSVSMLLIFGQFDGLATGAGMDMETISSQFRSLAKVDKYAVVGAPGAASTAINVMDKITPIDARTFDSSDQKAAWAFVGANPISTANV